MTLISFLLHVFTIHLSKHIQEHLYHVFENNRAPCSSEVIPPDPNAPELPPPLEPDSQDNDTPPVYQDITELLCKPNKLVDHMTVIKVSSNVNMKNISLTLTMIL